MRLFFPAGKIFYSKKRKIYGRYLILVMEQLY